MEEDKKLTSKSIFGSLVHIVKNDGAFEKPVLTKTICWGKRFPSFTTRHGKSVGQFILRINKFKSSKISNLSRLSQNMTSGVDNFACYIRMCDGDAIFSLKRIQQAQHTQLVTTKSTCEDIIQIPHRIGFNICVIGPFNYNTTLTAQRYRRLLLQDLEDALDNLQLNGVHNYWYQCSSSQFDNCLPILMWAIPKK